MFLALQCHVSPIKVRQVGEASTASVANRLAVKSFSNLDFLIFVDALSGGFAGIGRIADGDWNHVGVIS